MENKLIKLTKELKRICKYDEFHENYLNQLQAEVKRLRYELNQPQNIKIQEKSTPFISKISVVATSGK